MILTAKNVLTLKVGILSLVYNVSDKLKDEESSEVSDGENGDNSLA